MGEEAEEQLDCTCTLSPRIFGEDKVLGIYECLTESEDKEQWKAIIEEIDKSTETDF